MPFLPRGYHRLYAPCGFPRKFELPSVAQKEVCMNASTVMSVLWVSERGVGMDRGGVDAGIVRGD